MGHAAAEVQVALCRFLVANVGVVAIALEGSAEAGAEDVVQVSGGAVVAPMVADAAGGVVENPEVGGGCFSGPGGEEAQGSFVSLQVVGGEGFPVNGFCYGDEEAEAM